MKNKKSPVGQYILDGIGNTDEAHDYIYDLLPLIGEVVLFFNTLESDIDHLICQIISDRSDYKGLLVMHSMMYATKVDTYERCRGEEIRQCNFDIPKFKELISTLRECGTLRNRVVHANWQYTDDELYTHVRFKMGKDGLENEFVQFSIESLKDIIEKIIEARFLLERVEESIGDNHRRLDREAQQRS